MTRTPTLVRLLSEVLHQHRRSRQDL